MTAGDLIAYLSRWEDDTEVAFIVASPEKRVFYDTGDRFVITDVGRPVIAIDIVSESPFDEAETAIMSELGAYRSDTIQ